MLSVNKCLLCRTKWVASSSRTIVAQRWFAYESVQVETCVHPCTRETGMLWLQRLMVLANRGIACRRRFWVCGERERPKLLREVVMLFKVCFFWSLLCIRAQIKNYSSEADSRDVLTLMSAFRTMRRTSSVSSYGNCCTQVVCSGTLSKCGPKCTCWWKLVFLVSYRCV